jgi:mRNA-degrading endonuclease RelE of RelBE toxin-antitoxin system
VFVSHKTKRFQKLLDGLPAEARQQAKAAYQLFKENPRHPSLSFAPVPTAGEDAYSAKVGEHYRVIGYLSGNTILWAWIGTHEAYNHIVKQRR